MAKSDGEGKESYYSKVKAENEELKNKYGWLETESFLLDSQADIRNVYMFLKKNPGSAKFIYKKYKPLQSVIKELCDPENPLYLDGVKKSLEGIVQIEDSKENIQKLKQELASNRIEVEKLEKEIAERTKELDETEEMLETKKKELEDLQRARSNVKADPGLERIKAFIDEYRKLTEAIEEKRKDKLKTNPMETSLWINRETLDHMALLQKMAKELMGYIETDDFLSPENLDAYHKELQEKLRKEKEDVQNQIIAIQAMNPKKAINRAMDALNLAMKGLNKGEPMPDGGALFYKTGLNIIGGNLNEATDALSRLDTKLENVERRSK